MANGSAALAQPRADHRRRWLLGAFIGCLAYYGLARLGTALFALQPSNITILWLPIGVGVILVGSLGWRTLPLVALAAFVFSWDGMTQGDRWWQVVHVSASALADTLAVGLVVRSLRRLLPMGLRSVGDLTRLVLLVALPAVALSSLLLCLNLFLGRYLSAPQARALFETLLAADLLGLLLLVPGWMYWREGERLRAGQVPGLVASLALMALVVGVTFQSQPAALQLVVVLLVVVALRGSPLLLQCLLVPTVITMVAMAARVGPGPFAIGRASVSVQMLVTFLLSTALLTIGASLQRRELQREFRAAQHWLRLASVDPLTGLANRRAFDEQLQRHMEHRNDQSLALSLALIDIDHFKRINDQYGHSRGDAVLRAVAALMREEVRDSNLAARFGGEEFVVLLIGIGHAEAEGCLQRLHHRIEALQPEGIRVTISAGLAHARAAEPPEGLIARADALLYQAKQAGRNCLRVNA